MIRRRLAILVSGRGSNMDAILRAAENPDYPLVPVVVVSNRAGAPALEKARRHGIEAIHLKGGPTFEDRLVRVLEKRGVEVVALAGFMKLLRGAMLERFADRILNIHPSLLPSFPGLDAQAQAFEHGVRVSGCTVHLVDSGMDTGPILGQRCVDISSCHNEKEVASAILEQEHVLYPDILARFAMNLYRTEGRRTTEVKTGPHGQDFLALHFGVGTDPGQRDVAVSACLLGIPCRYAGDSRAHEGVLRHVEGRRVLPVCPEVLGGMWTPRAPMIVHGPTGPGMWKDGAQAISEDGENRTQALLKGAERAAGLVSRSGVREVILKERSPSCGLHRIHTPQGLKDGHGAFAEILKNMSVTLRTEEDFPSSRTENLD